MVRPYRLHQCFLHAYTHCLLCSQGWLDAWRSSICHFGHMFFRGRFRHHYWRFWGGLQFTTLSRTLHYMHAEQDQVSWEKRHLGCRLIHHFEEPASLHRLGSLCWHDASTADDPDFRRHLLLYAECGYLPLLVYYQRARLDPYFLSIQWRGQQRHIWRRK